MLPLLRSTGLSRRDTTALKTAHLAQLPIEATLGFRGWVHRALTIRVAESRAEHAEVVAVIKQRHYLRRWPAPPRTLLLSYLADLGGTGPAGAVVMVGMLPTNLGSLLLALGLHQAEVSQFFRCWRADDLGPEVAPDFLPEVLRRVVRRVAADWAEFTCDNLQARPKLLVSWADTEPGSAARRRALHRRGRDPARWQGQVVVWLGAGPGAQTGSAPVRGPAAASGEGDQDPEITSSSANRREHV